MNEESVFVAALQRSSDTERRAFLDEACGGDLALRRRVDALLEAHERTLGILDQSMQTPGWTSEAGEPSAPARAGHSVRVGTVLAGRYKLLEEIGTGGMGAVWKAEQTQPVRRIVAVKLIKAGMDSRTVLTRFEAERQALALMDHPNIAKVLDGGTTESGRPFFVMEYVKGVPFTQYCDDARLSIAQRLALFLPVCQAVQHAHTKGIIHRDLKPSNILLCLYDGQPVPKVIDFGLAKATQQPLTERTLHTAHGVLLGTPLYMSPEQAEFNNLDVDARTDIYALGVILYELLTGTTPLERRHFHEAAWHEMVRVIKEEEPPRPSARLSDSESLPSVAAQRCLEPVRLTKLVRGDLDWIVMKCLEKDRARRYETANSLERDVQRFLSDESVEARPPSASYRFSKFVRRNRKSVGAAATILLLLVAGIVGTTLGMVRAERAWTAEAARADGERKANTQAQMRLQQIERGSEILASVFKDLDPRAEEKEGRPLRAILGDRLAEAADELEGERIGDPLMVAELQYRLGLSLLHLGLPRQAAILFEKARATRSSKLGMKNRDTLTSMSALAEAYSAAGDLDKAIPLQKETLKLRTETLGADHSETLYSMNNLAASYKAQGDMTQALPLLEKTLELRKAKLGPDHPDTLNSMNNLAVAYQSADKLDAARPLLEETLRLRKIRLGVDHPDTLNSMNGLANWYISARKLDQAMPLLEQTLEMRKVRLGADHPDTLISMNNLAAGHRATGKLDLTLALLEETVKLSKARRGSDNPYTLGCMNNLAYTYRAMDKLDKAVQLFQEAATIIERRGFRDEFADGIISNLTATLEMRKQYADAEVWRRKWVAVIKKKAGAESLRYAGEMGMLGSNLLKQQKWSDAEEMLGEAYSILDKKASASLARFNVQSELGSALVGQGRYAEAEPLLIQGYEGIKAREAQLAPADRRRITESGEEIVRLYEVWGQPKNAAEWRAKLEEAR